MKVRLRRTRRRVYSDSLPRRVVSPAEYTVTFGKEKLAVIIKNGDGWRVSVPTETSKIGTAISPIGMDKFRAVRDWAFEYLEKI